MRQISVIARQTFKEAVRNKVLLVFVILSLITICCSIFMPVVGDGREKIRIVESLCFRSIAFFGTLAAVLLSASSVPTDIEDKVLCTVITKPVHRINIVLGKITGFLSIIGVLLFIMGSVSYVLIRLSASEGGDGQNDNGLLIREKFDPVNLQITGESARKVGDVSWIEGGGKGAAVWEFKGLYAKDTNDDLEIEGNFLIEGKKRVTGKIPIKIKVLNPYSGKTYLKSTEISRNKPVSLTLNGKFLGGSEELKIVVLPEESGDYIGMGRESLRVFWGQKSFEYNYLKGLILISAQFFLMVIIAVLGSTFLSLPVNILFCLFVYFCGNITDFMRDLSTVINVFHADEHAHGITGVMQKSNIFLLYLNYALKKPIVLISYILPDFKYFSIGNYFIDGINIPGKKIFFGFSYVVLYTVICLPVSFIVFRKKEMA